MNPAHKIDMYCVYIIRSKINKTLYSGATSNFKERLLEHNTGRVFSTKTKRPFEPIYCEFYKDKRDAFHREKMLKYKGQGLRRLKERLFYSLS
jgi:putative endonuclease